MSDRERKYSPVPSTSRRKREEDRYDEQPRERVRRRYTPPEGSRESSSSRPKEESPSNESRHSGSNENDRKPTTSETRKPRDAKTFYEIVRTRPESAEVKRGESGQVVKLEANYFKLLKRPEWSIYQYRVDFTPDIELVKLKRGILSEHKALLGGYIFDGSTLYVTRKLREDRTEIDAKSRKGDEFKIVIKFVATVSMDQWQSLQILNLILRRAMEGLQLQLIGRNFFDAMAKIDLHRHKLQLWPGYVTSIRQHESEILVCAEITHKVMRTETVYDILRECVREAQYRGGDYSENFRRQVIGLTVLTDYNNKTYRIDDVDLNFKASMTFEMKGKTTSFVDYYKMKYKLQIKDPNQPLLSSKNKDRKFRKKDEDNLIYLVPELCRVTGLAENMRTNMNLMKDMSNFTRSNPDRRIEKLKSFNNRLQETEVSQQVLKDWNMSLDRRLLQLDGRQLKPESIYFQNKIDGTDRADWTQCFRDNAMYTSVVLKRWAIIFPRNFSYDCRNFLKNVYQVAQGAQMVIERPNEIQISDDRNHSYIQAIERAASEDPKLILCLVPNKNAERYASIKKKCCVERAIATQVVCQANLKKGLSVVTKIVVQINAKLGGAPWMVNIPMSGLMVIGYDICKSTRDRSKAYAALVATMDQKKSPRYFSTVAQTHASDNLSNELNLAVGKAIHEYHRTHNALPDRIVLYRDGVGNGSINQVYEHEVKNLEAFLKNQYKKANLDGPRFSFIVVSKQINSKFFLNKRNPGPGTIIDDVVTLPERYDFYLISQSVRIGTVSPTSYNVLSDSLKLSPDRLQILTYKMCHLYYNWSGTIRVPAVCQYAKKLATLVAQHLHQMPSNLLEKQLYYL